MSDFRRCEYCLKYENIDAKKNELLTAIRKVHPQKENIHEVVSKRNTDFNISFGNIYNKKCAYCGISIDIIGNTKFEIDHFIYKKHPKFRGSEAKASHIENLVLSCSLCNSKKSAFRFSDKSEKLFNPDLYEYPVLYKRDEDYRIVVSDKYVENEEVLAFYNQLSLGSELRRIDYLLLELFGKIEKDDSMDPLKAAILYEKYFKLLKKRNNYRL